MDYTAFIDIQHVPDLSNADWLSMDDTATPVALYEHTLDKLRKGVAVFIFKKKNGDYRKAIGTLNEATIPKERGEETKRYIKPSSEKQTFYDLQINDFRSFNVDSLVALIDF